MPKGCDVAVVFTSGESVEGSVRFTPGGAMQGAVEIRPQEDLQCNHVWLRLKWHTEGRGAPPDEGLVVEADLFHGTLKAGQKASLPFTVELPNAPWSYTGRLVSIVWELEVDVDIPHAANIRRQMPVILSPGVKRGKANITCG